MSHQAEAEENLRVIRSLMEKATVYRAISAPGALFGGLLSLTVVAAAWWTELKGNGRSGLPFLETWLAVLVVTGAVNLGLLFRGATRRGEAFISPGMRLALRAMLPALLGGGIVVLPLPSAWAQLDAGLWVLFYGISLLAASHFAPKSICWLGRAFFATGLLLLPPLGLMADWWRGFASDDILAHSVMGATFGLFHLAYAACTWPRRSAFATKP